MTMQQLRTEYDALLAAYRAKNRELKELRRSRKMQFSQKICIFSCIFIVAIWLGNFVLAWFDKPQIPEAISVGFTIFGGFVTGGYFALSGVRDCSLNKLKAKLKEDENDG